MNEEEIQKLIEQLKAVGLDDEKIMDVFFTAYKEGKMDRKDLETLSGALGYELDDEFKEDPTPDPIKSGGENKEAPTASELEDIRDIKPSESKEEFKEKAENLAERMPSEDSKEPAEDGGSDSDADAEEWEKAQKMFKI